jgi:hypothetical protein
LLEKSEGGRGSGGALSLLPLRVALGPRAGVLGMPGRCSQEKGTAEARSGERKRWWNGDGAGDGKEKEADEDVDDDDADEDVEAGADEGVGETRRRRRRRLAAAAGAGGRSGDGEDGLGIARECVFVELGEVKFGGWGLWCFYGWVMASARARANGG